MIGTEQEAIAFAVTECATSGREFQITDSQNNLIWEFERDTKVDEDDLSWPVHLRGAMADDQVAVLMETES